jgi:Mn2+/Fe2+ NRAMP family transporter
MKAPSAVDCGGIARNLPECARENARPWHASVSRRYAVLLQGLSLKLGVVAERDLAQACRDAYPSKVCFGLWCVAARPFLLLVCPSAVHPNTSGVLCFTLF